MRTEAAQAEPDPAPEPQLRPVPRRRALRLAAASAAVGLVVSGLWLGQHGETGPFVEIGYGKVKTAVVAVASMAISACAGLTGKVRTGDKDWLAKCPAASRKAVNELNLETSGGLAWMIAGPNVIIPEQGGVEVRDGYVEVVAAISTPEKGYQGYLTGQMRTGSDGASLHFTKFRLWQEGDPDDGPPSGPELDVCAVASVRGYRDRPGIPKVEHPRDPSMQLHPGYVFVTTGALEIQFAH